MGNCNCNNQIKVINSRLHQNGFIDKDYKKLRIKRITEKDFESEDESQLEHDISISILIQKDIEQHKILLHQVENNSANEEPLLIDPLNLNLMEELSIGCYFDKELNSYQNVFINSLKLYLSKNNEVFNKNILTSNLFQRDMFIYSISSNILSIKKYYYANKDKLDILVSKSPIPSCIRLSILIILLESQINNVNYKLISFKLPKHKIVKKKTRNYFSKKNLSLILLDDNEQETNLKQVKDNIHTNREVNRLKMSKPISHTSQKNISIIKSNSKHKIDDYEKIPEYSEIDQFHKIKETIKKDLNRTFPSDERFSHKKVLINLEEVLLLITQVDPELGYLQGMNYIADYCLFISGNNKFYAINLFFLLFNIKSYRFKVSLRECLLGEFKNLNILIFGFNQIFEMEYKQIYKKFKELGVIELLWVSKWIMTLFTYNFSVSMTLCFWEFICLYGFDSMIYISLFLIDEFKEDFMKKEVNDLEECLKIFQKMNDYDVECVNYRHHLHKYLNMKLRRS